MFLEKSVPLTSLPAILIFTLSLLILRTRAYAGSFPGWVQSHRDVVAVTVQMVSSLLGILQVVIVCSLINFAARIRLFQVPTSLDNLTFWSALSVPRLDTSQPLGKVIVVAFAVLLGPLFGAVWSGALAPTPTTIYELGGNITLPSPTWMTDPTQRISTDGVLDLRCNSASLNTTSEPKVEISISTCPALDLSAALIASARTATSQATPRSHTKIDNTDWTYYGRSYGVGASQGLFGPTGVPNENYTGYSYLENGYNTNVSCSNTSTPLIAWKQNLSAGGPTDIYFADTLNLPDGNVSMPLYEIATANITYHVPSFIAWATTSANNSHRLATSSHGTWYRQFDTTLCTIAFQPTRFNVTVNLAAGGPNTMTVTPLPNATTSFDPTGILARTVTADLDLISRISSNLVVSTLGTAVGFNQQHLVNSQPDLLLPDASRSSGTVALEIFLTSLLDDFLVARGTEQLAYYRNTTTAAVTRHFPAEKIGSATFHYYQFAISMLLFLGVAVEALRTRFWRSLPPFNFVNAKSLAAAAIEPVMMVKDQESEAADDDGSTMLVAYYDKGLRPRLRYEVAKIEGPAASPPFLATGLERRSVSSLVPLLDAKVRE